MIDFKSLKSFDWRSLKKYADPKVSEDVNAFLEKLPQHAGQSILVMAGIAWAASGAIGLYTTLQIQKMTELRTKLQEAEALQPIVPIVKDVPVDPKEVTAFVDKIKGIYGGLSIKANGPSILITATSTGGFSQFREAIGHIQNGGIGWRVNIERFCVGRECERVPLAAALKINKVSVDKPG
ncbi:MAG: hypothetical protein WBK77_04680 [Alphaproteobacteria bacterium]